MKLSSVTTCLFSSDFHTRMNFDWKDTIKLNFLMMKIVGLWPKEKYKINFYTLYTLISVNLFICGHVIFHTVAVFVVGRDLKHLIGALYMSLTETLLLVKICYFIKNSRLVKSLLTSLDGDIFQPKNEKQLELTNPSLIFWKKVHKSFAILVANTVFLFVSLPILSKSTKLYRLPLEAWYPYNTQKSPNYEITYLYQFISTLFRGMASVSMDTFIAALNMYIGVQCDILCDNLRNLNETNFMENLSLCIKHHKAIVRFDESLLITVKICEQISFSFARECNKFYNGIVLGQFFSTSIALGLAMFLLSLVTPLSTESNTLLFYLGATTSEIFLYCWFGNEVDVKSSKIPYSAFESDWTGAPIEAKKNLLIFILRTQKPIKMSAINLFSLSLETFTTILRTSWSYFAVLRQVNGQA
nr:PREDICTED: odorant receptor Or1 isoform X2 [Tribolium castaneum]|eukprot:XP_015833040.1 PREDICTED: odorant receptor Or1 isoform X2 [Tribolium castaneum]